MNYICTTVIQKSCVLIMQELCNLLQVLVVTVAVGLGELKGWELVVAAGRIVELITEVLEIGSVHVNCIAPSQKIVTIGE